MFIDHFEVVPTQVNSIMLAVEKAARAIPPAFPLNATVAVNPYLGQIHEDLATTSARLMRVAGVRATQSPQDYRQALAEGRISTACLAAALDASPLAPKPADVEALLALVAAAPDTAEGPLPTIADLAARETGRDWPAVIEKSIGLWAAGHFDKGQALWSPAPGLDAYAAWIAWAMHDLTPEIAGLSGFCARAAAAPDTAERAILKTTDAIGLSAAAAETAFHRLYMDIGGWSQHARWLHWQAEMAGQTDNTLASLLAIRLIWEEALLDHVPQLADAWATAVAAHGAPVAASATDVALAILQEAAERTYQRALEAALTTSITTPDTSSDRKRPLLQAAFCIDVRSEVFRRALENVDPRIETIGFAGFFGLPLSHKAMGSDVAEAHLPVLLAPALETDSHCNAACEQKVRIGARATRAWGRFRQAAVSSFAFVEAAGPLYAGKLVKDALGLQRAVAQKDPAPKLPASLSPDARADTAAAILKAMSLSGDFAKVVLLVGHGGNVTNNAHESAYHCGACGGYTGEVSARLLAILLNDPETRRGLPQRGITIPGDTVFIAGLHDTTTDAVTLHDASTLHGQKDDLTLIQKWLAAAGGMARAERAMRLPGSTGASISARAFNWAEVRPEWGLAGCAAFIAAPREGTAGRDLGGRAFLHSYDWRADAGFGTLELILTAPVVVASWISLQYYGSTVQPDVFGGGNKLIHNVVGGIGVIEGNGGRLRPGLPLQAVHDGAQAVHQPLRLTVMIEAPRNAILDVLARHQDVRALFDNGWLHLFTLRDGQIDARYQQGHGWQEAH